MTSKTCTGCLKLKPIEAFSKAGRGKDKKQLYKSQCKDCTNLQMRDERKILDRNHHENVVRERCPHGGGIRRVPIRGWGFAE